MIVPLKDKLLAVLDAPPGSEKQTDSGLFLPGETRTTDTLSATVRAAGRDLDALDFAPGDRILFAPYGFDTVQDDDGTECVIVAASLVLARYPRNTPPTPYLIPES